MTAKCEEHSGCMEAISTLKENDKEQWTAINQIKNRPPVWITIVYTISTGVFMLVIGMLSGYLKAKGG